MNITVIGAGKTGRGFLGRLLNEQGMNILFIDSSLSLVRQLKAVTSYTIEYFGNVREPKVIGGYRILHTQDPATPKTISQSDIVFTAVGAGNLGAVAELLAAALNFREQDLTVRKPFLVITAENAINPADKLQAGIRSTYTGKSPYAITESAIFCSTIEKPNSATDIISEAFDVLPFDSQRIPSEYPLLLSFLKPEQDFPLLLTRKIFTYNCASAAIAYLGAYKGYHLYGDAANDPVIHEVVSRLYRVINQTLCTEYGLTEEDQQSFAETSRKKFQNRLILDSIERNARDASRKLAPDERMIGPLLLMNKQGLLSSALSLVIAAAMVYSIAHEPSIRSLNEHGGGLAILSKISLLEESNPMVPAILQYFELLKNHEPLESIALQ